MFQYAAGLALAEHRRTVLKLDVDWFRENSEYEDHNRYGLSCFNITEQFAAREEIDRVRGVTLTHSERWAAGLARVLRLYQYSDRYRAKANLHRSESFEFYPGFFDQPDNTYLHGMWQSERFFAPVADLLRMHFSFRYPMLPAVVDMMARIRNSGPSAAVDFRRGDYVRNASFNSTIGVIGFDYYSRAMELLRQKHPGITFYLFSDDIDAIERDLRTTAPCVFVRAVKPWHSYDKIRLMSACNHAIISNSTFAWWGAWLNPDPQKTVIAPDPWFAGKIHDDRDLVPAGWTRIPAA
jgi:hypothetical protein